MPFIKFKEFSLYNIIETEATFFFALKVGLLVERFAEHKIIFKSNGCINS